MVFMLSFSYNASCEGYDYNNFSSDSFISSGLIALAITIVVLSILMVLVGLLFGLECMNCIPTKDAWMLVAMSIVMILSFGTCS